MNINKWPMLSFLLPLSPLSSSPNYHLTSFPFSFFFLFCEWRHVCQPKAEEELEVLREAKRKIEGGRSSGSGGKELQAW